MLSKADRMAVRASLPVLFGYLPLGITFGLLFGKLGYPWYFATLGGLVVYAGAAQFLSVSLLASHVPLPAILMATLFLNLRHMFYGFSLFNRFPEGTWPKAYLIFGLTDETYSVLTATKSDDKEVDHRFCITLTALNHAYWVIGCTLGGSIGRYISVDIKGIDFVLTALFAVLAVEQALSVRRTFPFVLAAAAAAVALALRPGQFLPISMGLVFCGLVGLYYNGDRRHE